MREPGDVEDFGAEPDEPPKAMEHMRGWRRLRSMRTAIQLLIAVALVSVVGSIVPQRNAAPSKVAEFKARNRLWGEIFERLHLFEVFTSWWFLTLVALLMFVTAACLIPRTSSALAQFRRFRRAPAPGRLPGLSTATEIASKKDVVETTRISRSVLRQRRWRCTPVNDERQWLAEKGLAREVGSVLFHWSFFLVVMAAALTITTKFEGSAVIVEGASWTEGGPVNFDEYSEGALARWINPHAGFVVKLDDFEVRYREDGMPESYTSRVRIVDEDHEVLSDEIRVNKPLSYQGVKLYQLGFGWAPVLRVIDRGTVVYDGPLVMGVRGPNGSSVGVIKLPSSIPRQAGIEMTLFSDFKLVPFRATNPDDPRAKEPGALDIVSTADLGERPLIVVTEYRGNLNLDRPQNVYELDKSALEQVMQKFATFPANANEKLGSRVELGDGLEIELLELRRFSVLSVKRDRLGIPAAALAGVAMMFSIYPALYSYRRRLWLEVDEGPDGGVVLRFDGVAYQRKQLFDGERLRLRNDLERSLREAGTTTEKAPR